MQPLRGIVIGAGYFSGYQLEAWSRIGGVRIVAVCDREIDRARERARQFDIANACDDPVAAIERERPDFVDIITPPATHETIVRDAAERGVRAIICQKPLAPTLADAERIVAAAREHGVRFMVHENFRWQPWYREAKRIQQAGTIGDFTHVHILTRTGDGWGDDAYVGRQPFFRDMPRLLVFETGIHFIDTFRFLLGEVTHVYAQIKRLNPVIKGEDAGQLFLRFTSGATAMWDANRYNETEAADPRYTFGQMRIDATDGHLTLSDDGTIRLKPLGQPAREHAYHHPKINFGGDCVHAIQRHFFERMRSGAPFESTGEDYLRTMRVVEACYESSRRDQVITLTASLSRFG